MWYVISFPPSSHPFKLAYTLGENPSKKFTDSAFSCNQRISQVAFTEILVWIPSGPFVRRESAPPPSLRLLAARIDLQPPRYNSAKTLKESQDAYCAKVTGGQFEDLGEFPEDLAWEPLSEVLRGRVKVRSEVVQVYALLTILRFKSIVMKLRTWTASRGWEFRVCDRTRKLNLSRSRTSSNFP